eukprot:Em0001g865a
MSASAAPTTRGPDVKLVQIVAPTVVSVFILFSLLIVAYVIMKVLKRRRDVSIRSATEHSDVIQGTCSTQRSIRLNADEIQHFKGLFKDSLITYAQLHCDKESIGEGAFGKVYKGMLTKPGCSVEQVAIKTIKNITSDNDMKNFLKESALMIQFHHQNILGLLGVCFDSPDGTPLMVLPFMVNGSLKSYLVKSRNPLSVKPDIFPNGLGLAIMTRMCTDIARGMSYLADQRFVHRDLAARNCLLDQDLSIKIGDFGLARDVYMTDYYKASTHAALPVKWMPPEMLHDGISNEKTDVWAYGVTCWEVFSLGATPYPGVDNHLVLEHLMKGFRLVKPVLCTEEIDKKLSLKQLVNLCHSSEVEAVKHFLYGITIDEGADGLRAISLAWDVLYPEILRFVRTREEQVKILAACHLDPTAGHMGEKRTVKRIVKDVKEMIHSCDVCQRVNRKMITSKSELHPVPVKAPWYHIGIDFIIQSVLLQARETAVALPTKNADGVSNALFKLFMRMGIPKLLTSASQWK